MVCRQLIYARFISDSVGKPIDVRISSASGYSEVHPVALRYGIARVVSI